MKLFAHLCTAALLFTASLGFALPKVSVDVFAEVASVDQMLDELQNYESRFWAVGLNGDTLQPDQFQKFFADRGMEVRYFVRSTSGVSLGAETAYQENRRMLQDYRHRTLLSEIFEVELIIRQLQIAKEKDAAVGFTAGMLQPDSIIRYFGQHGLEIRYYVRDPGFTLGDSSAYDQNLKVLQNFKQRLTDLDKASAQ